MKTWINVTMLVLVSLAMVLTVRGRSLNVETKTSWPPAFCNGLDCPKYTVLDNNHTTWEERFYDVSQWVGTSSHGMDLDTATREMFMKLFDYIEGANKQGVTVEMAAPVLVKATINEKEGTLFNNFTMFFYLPFIYQNATAPSPSDPEVFLWTKPCHTAFVRSFPGYTSAKKDLLNTGALAMDLQDKWSYDHRYFYYAGYDSPWHIIDRHNEIWFVGTK
ncbi:heme-binding protein 2-like [Diadema antillarum]|uniref:heme-binding protein 2-like n=1 Tax=Diadema antillarum TaxID=105358 RepID=UPI003A8A8E2E